MVVSPILRGQNLVRRYQGRAVLDVEAIAVHRNEVLAILGREGVDLATRWVVPASGSRTEEAFRLFLDYDGAGANLFGDRVRALSSLPATVGAYSIRGHADELYLLLFNKAASARETTITISGPLAPGGFALWRPNAASIRMSGSITWNGWLRNASAGRRSPTSATSTSTTFRIC